MSVSAASCPVATSNHCNSRVQTLPQRCQQLHQRGITRRLNHAQSRSSSSRNTESIIRCAAGKQWETGCKLVGCGSSAPEAVLSNKDLEQLVETNDDWIASRTGIRRRHILGKHETLSDHAAKASQQALDMAGIHAEDVDLIILATSSSDDLFGSACRVCIYVLLQTKVSLQVRQPPTYLNDSYGAGAINSGSQECNSL